MTYHLTWVRAGRHHALSIDGADGSLDLRARMADALAAPPPGAEHVELAPARPLNIDLRPEEIPL